MRNGADEEAARLGKLQSLHDAATVRQFERSVSARAGVAPSWERAPGRWRRGWPTRSATAGSVTAIDRDTSRSRNLAARPNVTVVEDDLMTMSFGSSCFDLVHSRSVLMHVDDPDAVVERLVPALAPGAVVLFEEADGAPAQRAVGRRDLPTRSAT